MHRSNATKRAVLSVLLERRGNLVSSGLLRTLAGVTRQAIWKSVESLREEGFPILSVPQKGYILKEAAFPDLAPSWIDFLLKDSPWGHPVLLWESLPSTQEVLKQMARNGTPAGALCLAEEQTLGRGRRGRVWSSPPRGGLYFSLLSRPRLLPSKIQLLNLAAGLSVSRSLQQLFGIPCQLKWPNDILWQGKKLCGILSETACEADRVHYAVTGIGINANIALSAFPRELSDQVTSLASILGREIDRGRVVAEIISDLHRRLALLENPSGEENLIAAYGRHCHTLRREVRVLTGERIYEGLAVALSAEGALCVETEEGLLSFSAADVVHLRPR
ncbi:biotin--[acetyl-CoA-carboxylase] ligase [Aminirod propionatiphilus]|uniref:Biotin--[acetyl-CoA-carboxylase] ligase n=1 Tax=Aminirod propionatiphilus TaxID=3415223 RepID=A0ACD1DYT5_9BACT|nr:biotin--[acetyl-CoA-carboxylase] ligase [Synergistota bacterium]